MEIKIETQGNETLLKIKGRIDTATAVEFEKAIAPIIQTDMQMVVVDCKEFDYISSTGLRLFLTLHKTAKAKGGKLILRDMNADIKSVFDMTGFTPLFTFE